MFELSEPDPPNINWNYGKIQNLAIFHKKYGQTRKVMYSIAMKSTLPDNFPKFHDTLDDLLLISHILNDLSDCSIVPQNKSVDINVSTQSSDEYLIDTLSLQSETMLIPKLAHLSFSSFHMLINNEEIRNLIQA
jgi:hypothetical protein